MPRSLKRGARPSPRSMLAAAKPHAAVLGAPPHLIVVPQRLSMWGNDVYGDCVAAEEAFAKACNNPEIFIADDDVIDWAARHNVLDGATLVEVLQAMQNDGFNEGTTIYDDGPFFSVDWGNATTMQSAIAVGPVKIGIAADQLEAAYWTTNGRTGWFATGFHGDDNLDHCVALCGYGSMSWLAQQLGVQVPAGIDGSLPGYALYTWQSIGIIDAASMVAITGEAWLRQPTTVTVKNTFFHLQVKSSGQYLNILNASMSNGAMACQGVADVTPNFEWQVLPASNGYFFLKVKSSGQYLNILNASMNNGAMACQGVANTTDNFLWQFVSVAGATLSGPPDPGTEFLLRVKSSGQYLNILNGAMNNGAEACQGVAATTANFVWKLALVP